MNIFERMRFLFFRANLFLEEILKKEEKSIKSQEFKQYNLDYLGKPSVNLEYTYEEKNKKRDI